MTVMAECEKCGHKWEIELKPRETIQCPNCKGIFDMWILMNDPQNREFVEWLNSQSREKKNNKKEITIPVSQNDVQTAYYKLKHRIAELEEKISVLLSCKNCPENKGGLICEKEYENKCLAQKMQYIKELQEENAELKEQNTNLQEMLKTERSVTCKEEYLKKVTELEQEITELKAVERMALYSRMSDRLAKAEELLLELYDCIPSSMADSCKEILQKVALFFKDSEVEK